jgi:hypothetical protein
MSPEDISEKFDESHNCKDLKLENFDESRNCKNLKLENFDQIFLFQVYNIGNAIISRYLIEVT